MSEGLENPETAYVDVTLRIRNPNPTAETAGRFIGLKVREGKTYGQAKEEVVAWYKRLINHPDTPDHRRPQYRAVVEEMTELKEHKAYEGMTLLFG